VLHTSSTTHPNVCNCSVSEANIIERNETVARKDVRFIRSGRTFARTFSIRGFTFTQGLDIQKIC